MSDQSGTHLWTPWRMAYVGSGSHEDGCIFCNRFKGGDDVTSLILHRDEHFFVIMNRYPYNTGHAMVVPTAHVAGPEDADPETLAAMAAFIPRLLAACRLALNCDGFNMGVNVGTVAGAGVAVHLHEHVVPRWHGDANFLSIIAGTKVLPELLPVTYAKLRAELAGASSSATSMVVMSADGSAVLTDGSGGLPNVHVSVGTPRWRSAADWVEQVVAEPVALIGWAGNVRVESEQPVLAMKCSGSTQPLIAPNWRWSPIRELPEESLRFASRASALASPLG